ncbi:MAG: hypothetical protein BRC24_00520, partial [Parcubacteria group bacterium SW_4_46_8]
SEDNDFMNKEDDVAEGPENPEKPEDPEDPETLEGPDTGEDTRPGGQFLRDMSTGDDSDDSDGEGLGAQAGFGGQCGEYLTDHLRRGWNNDQMEVMKLQTFLNVFTDANLPLTGTFDRATEQAVDSFQMQYSNDILNPWVNEGFMDAPESTGFVYLMTRWKINSMVCNAFLDQRPEALTPYSG